jgi:hypothetical protein
MVKTMVEVEKVGKASTVLGILSVCLFWLTWPGAILGIIGLSLKKRQESRGRDIALNTIGLVLSLLWMFYVFGTM